MQAHHPLRGRLADVEVTHHVRVQQRHADDEHQHRRFLERARKHGFDFGRTPQSVNHRDQRQRQDRAEARRFRRRRVAPVKRHHHTGQQHDKRHHARQPAEFLRQRKFLPLEMGRGRARGRVGGMRRTVFKTKTPSRIRGKQRHQQQPRSDAREKKPTERLLRGDRVKNHRDRRRQQNPQRAARRDDPRRETRRVTTPPHFRNTRAADRRACGRTRTGHRGEKRAREHICNPEPARHPVQPRMNRRVQIGASARFSNRGALQNKQRDRKQRDTRHLLVDVLRDGIERGCRHENRHEQQSHRAQRECDRHADQHDHQRRRSVQHSNHTRAHGLDLSWASRTQSNNASCKVSSVIPAAISEYGIQSGGAHVEDVVCFSAQAS